MRWSSTSKPSLGGISLFFTFLFSVLVFAGVSTDENIFDEIEFLGFLLAAVLAFAIGVADDAYDTKPLLKLAGQISCGVIIVLSGSAIDVFHLPFLDAFLTIVWVVAVMNSLNMLDNMDGITGTVSLFILLTAILALGFVNDPSNQLWTILMIAEIGAIIGFLCYNIHPAKMFMGDTGSQFIGLFVAFFGIKAFWNLPANFELPSWSSVFLILAVFTPAVADTLTVVINRTKRGVSVMVGGKDHTTHHMVYRGFSDFKVWLVFVFISVLSSLISISMCYCVVNEMYVFSILALPFFLMVFFWLYRNTIKYKAPVKAE